MSGVVGMNTIRADQIGPADKPAFADRVDERRTRVVGLTAEGVAHVEHVERRIGGRPRRTDHEELRRGCDTACQIEGVVRHARHLHGVHALVVAGAEEHHQRIVGVDGPVGQVLENAAVVTADDVARSALGCDVGRDLDSLACERQPGAGGPSIRPPAAFIRTGGIGVPDHRDVINRGASGHRVIGPRRGRTVVDQSDHDSNRDDNCGQTAHRYLHCPPPRTRISGIVGAQPRFLPSTRCRPMGRWVGPGQRWRSPHFVDGRGTPEVSRHRESYLISVWRSIVRVARLFQPARAERGFGRPSRPSWAPSIDCSLPLATCAAGSAPASVFRRPTSTIPRIHRRAGSSTR